MKKRAEYKGPTSTSKGGETPPPRPLCFVCFLVLSHISGRSLSLVLWALWDQIRDTRHEHLQQWRLLLNEIFKVQLFYCQHYLPAHYLWGSCFLEVWLGISRVKVEKFSEIVSLKIFENLWKLKSESLLQLTKIKLHFKNTALCLCEQMP